MTSITKVDRLLERPRQTLATLLIEMNSPTSHCRLSPLRFCSSWFQTPRGSTSFSSHLCCWSWGSRTQSHRTAKCTANCAAHCAPASVRIHHGNAGQVLLSALANGLVQLTGGDSARQGLELREEQLKNMIREGSLEAPLNHWNKKCWMACWHSANSTSAV